MKLMLLLMAGLTLAMTAAVHAASPYQVGGNQSPDIIVQYDAQASTGADWAKVNRLQWHSQGDEMDILRAAVYLQEAITRMTGQQPEVASSHELSKGIILTTLAGATSDIRQDQAVIKALANDGSDAYNHNEAYYIRSEKDRVLVVANTPDGLMAGVVALAESVGYEVLGMGPRWIHTPDFKDKPLVFNIETAGRPGYYIRSLWATSGQLYGVGTINDPKLINHPEDEIVSTSYVRWRMGTRMQGQSMPNFPGHALQALHDEVVKHMVEHKTTEGFLSEKTVIGPVADRPEATEENKAWIWIDPAPGVHEKTGKALPPAIYHATGKEWRNGPGWNLDLSVPFVREILLQSSIKRMNASLAKEPGKPVIIAMDAEDGAAGNAVLDERMKYKDWYPQYLKKEGLPFGRPYVLHGHNGLDQPRETWDPSSASDNMFATATWLLHEMDKHIDSLPEEEQKTADGQSKKDVLRVSFYSYNYHDVPPLFNPDQRIRVMIAGYPKHRGMGRWEKFRTSIDMAKAFQVMLPREPSGDYEIISLAYYRDPGVGGMVPHWSNAAASIVERYREKYDAGFKALNAETDFNFGKFGLGYYLIAKVLWNPKMSASELDAIRDRWFQRAFGSGWREMKQYYDFTQPENYPVNGPNAWAQVLQFIDAADKKVDPAKEPDAQKRIDDIKLWWYYHFMTDQDRVKTSSQEYKTFFWKGQMAYTVAMHVVMRRDLNQRSMTEAVKQLGEAITSQPAHYTHEETQVWWNEMLKAWPYTPVARFSDAKLADGTPASEVDMNDLVRVAEFGDSASRQPYVFNSAMSPLISYFTYAAKAGDEVGFTIYWPFRPEDRYYMAKDIYYGAQIYDPAARQWEEWQDINQAHVSSSEVQGPRYALQVARVSLKAPKAGTYRFTLSRAGNLSQLGGPTLDVQNNQPAATMPMSFNHADRALTQSPVWFYIPKGTKKLDLEVWDEYKRKIITLYKALPDQNPKPARTVDVSAIGTYSVELEEGEDGTVARIDSNGFAFPYFYSIPIVYAKSPGELLVPRKIAEADGLTIVKE